MNIFAGLFKRNAFYGEISVPVPMSHFMNITAPGGVSETFQISALDAKRAVAALDGDFFFYFTTLFGRHCAVNFKLVQAVHIFEEAKISSSDREIEGALVRLTGRKKDLDIPGDQVQIGEFFKQLKCDLPFAQLGEWRFNTSDIVAVVATEAYTLPEQTFPNSDVDAGKYKGLRAMFREHGLE